MKFACTIVRHEHMELRLYLDVDSAEKAVCRLMRSVYSLWLFSEEPQASVLLEIR